METTAYEDLTLQFEGLHLHSPTTATTTLSLKKMASPMQVPQHVAATSMPEGTYIPISPPTIPPKFVTVHYVSKRSPTPPNLSVTPTINLSPRISPTTHSVAVGSPKMTSSIQRTFSSPVMSPSAPIVSTPVLTISSSSLSSPVKTVASSALGSPSTKETLDIYSTLCQSDTLSPSDSFSLSPISIQPAGLLSTSLPNRENPLDADELNQESEMDVLKRMLLFVITKFDDLTKDVEKERRDMEDRMGKIVSDRMEGMRENLEAKYETKFANIENAFNICRLSREAIITRMTKENDELRMKNASISEQWRNHMDRLHQHVLVDDEVSNVHPAIEERFLIQQREIEEKVEKKISDVNREQKERIVVLEEQLKTQFKTHMLSFSEECRRNSESEEDEGPGDEDPVNSADVDELKRIIQEMDTRILELDVRVLECEQYSRRESVVISGIPGHIQDNQLEETVIDILKNLQIYIQRKDISAIHRLGKPRDTRYPARVIVKFINRKITDLCFERKSWLEELKPTLKMNLRFYESLAQLNQEALRICKWLQENGLIHSYFLRNGFSKIVMEEREKAIKVPHPQFLRDKFEIPVSVT